MLKDDNNDARENIRTIAPAAPTPTQEVEANRMEIIQNGTCAYMSPRPSGLWVSIHVARSLAQRLETALDDADLEHEVRVSAERRIAELQAALTEALNEWEANLENVLRWRIREYGSHTKQEDLFAPHIERIAELRKLREGK